MASIRERHRKDGTSYHSVLFTIDDRQSSITFNDPDDAQYAAELMNKVGLVRAVEILKIVRTPRAGMTVEKWLNHHVDHLTGVEQKTIDDYRRYIRRDIAPILGGIPLSALEEEDIAKWVKHLEVTGGHGGKGQKPKTIRNKHGFLSGALAAAVPKHMPSNPAAGRRLPRGDGEDEDDEMRMLSHEEFALLLSCTTEYWRPLMEFGVATGCRWGELVALKPTDIDRAKGVVKVRRAWKLDSNGYHIGPPKTRRSRRNLNVAKSILDKLDYSSEWLFTNSGRGKGKFANGVVAADASPVRYSNFRRNVWDPAVARAGLDPKPTPHDLRHTCASWMLNANIPITAVSRHLGHESIQVTVDTYGDVDRTTASAVADAMEAILGGS
jgi:integrase